LLCQTEVGWLSYHNMLKSLLLLLLLLFRNETIAFLEVKEKDVRLRERNVFRVWPQVMLQGTYLSVALMDVIGFLCVSLDSSTVQLHDTSGSRYACSCSKAGFNSQNDDRA
jgi:hypothetical protein